MHGIYLFLVAEKLVHTAKQLQIIIMLIFYWMLITISLHYSPSITLGNLAKYNHLKIFMTITISQLFTPFDKIEEKFLTTILWFQWPCVLVCCAHSERYALYTTMQFPPVCIASCQSFATNQWVGFLVVLCCHVKRIPWILIKWVKKPGDADSLFILFKRWKPSWRSQKQSGQRRKDLYWNHLRISPQSCQGERANERLWRRRWKR